MKTGGQDEPAGHNPSFVQCRFDTVEMGRPLLEIRDLLAPNSVCPKSNKWKTYLRENETFDSWLCSSKQ